MPEKKRYACSECPHTGKQGRPVPVSPSNPAPEKPKEPQTPQTPERKWVTRLLDILKIVIGLANLILGLFKH